MSARKIWVLEQTFTKDDRGTTTWSNPPEFTKVREAWFHRFAQFGDENGSEALAIIELADGSVQTRYPHLIQFREPPKGPEKDAEPGKEEKHGKK